MTAKTVGYRYIAGSKPGKMFGKQLILILSAILIVSLIVPLCSATSIQKFGIDSKTYSPEDKITISGQILDGNSSEVEISIWPEGFEFTDISNQTANKTIAVDVGLFSTTMSAPSDSGRYTIVAVDMESNSISPYLYFNVLGVNDPNTIEVLLTEGEVLTVPLSSSHDIFGPMGEDKVGGNLIFEDKTYYFLVSDNNVAYMDDDSYMEKNSDVIENLVEGSKVKLNTTKYTLIYINNNSEIVLARPVAPSFEGNESINVTMLALNTINMPVATDIRLDQFKDDGELITRTDHLTGDDGIATIDFTVQNEPGTYHLVAGDVGHMSYSVNKYSMYGEILSVEYTPQHLFASDQSGMLAVYLKNSDDELINDSLATVSANIKGPGEFNAECDLTFDEEMGLYSYTFFIPADAPSGEYKVEFIADINSQTQKAYTGFEIKGYDIFLFPVSPQRHELEGFAPGEIGYIFVGGSDMGTGEEADINGLTDNSNKSKFSFMITDSKKTDVTDEGWSVINLSTFFDENNVPPWMQDEIERHARDASIITFQTPSSTGIYDVKVSVNLNGTVEEAYTNIGVQDIFVDGQPTTSDGRFAPMVSRYDNVTLMIMAFDPKTMDVIPAENITDAGLIEVFSEAEGELVTEYMENAELVDINMQGQSFKGLRFYVNDSNLGFHHVKFWINATRQDGTSTKAIGQAFFDTKLYNIWAYPVGEDGTHKTFTSESDVTIRVEVRDSGYNPVQGKTVTVDKVRFGETWELVDFDTSNANVSATTNDEGIANLTISTTDLLKSGWYDVSVKVAGTDSAGNTVYDFGNGWFEIRSFMFDVYSEKWDVQTGENITFVVTAADPSDMSQTMDASITLSKIYYMGSWNNPKPPVLIEGPYELDKNIISTNATVSDTVTYIGNAIDKAGSYEFVFEAESNGNVVVRRAWVESNPFVAWAHAEDWNNRFGVGENMSIIVEASDSWGGVNMHNITTNTTVTMVMKEGMFGGTPYKTESDLTITAQQESPNKINLTINLDGWDEGNYFMNIKAVDENGVSVFTDFWFQVEVASVGLPQFYWAHVDEGNTQTTRTSVRIEDKPAQVDEWEKSADGRYPSLNYLVASNAYVGKVHSWEGINLLTDWRMEEERRPFWMLVNITSPRQVYINFNNANFSDSVNTTDPLTVGDTFEELDEYNNPIREWNVTYIGSDGTVEFTGVDCLASGYNINTSLSKSGEFLVCDWMSDEEWLNVDLDGNGDYWQNWDTRENLYYLILADSETAGVYDKVLVANTTNFTNAIDASAGEAVGFGGAPIYLVNMMYQNNGYELRFTSYKQGWDGEWLGIFQNGENVTIPFLVQKPGSNDAISGGIGDVNVTIDKFTKHMPGNDKTIGVSATTNEYGLAMLTVNTSAYDIPNGQYLIHYVIELPEPYNTTISPMEKWRLPGLELRSFVVDASLGTVGQMEVNKVYDGNGISVKYGKEIEVEGTVSMYQEWWGNPDVLRLGWPFDMNGNSWYYNTANESFHSNSNGDAGYVPSDSISLDMEGQEIVYNFTDVYPAGDSVTIGVNESAMCWNYWNITVNSVSEDSSAELVIGYTPFDWEEPQARIFYLDEFIGWAPGPLDAKVTAITSENVTLELDSPKAFYNIADIGILMDGNESNGEIESGRASIVSYNNYTIYGYNDVDQTEVEKSDEWCNNFDRVLVSNETSSNVYRIGEEIPELGNEYVAMAAPWGGKMIFADPVLTHGLFPLSEWAPDGDVYYIGTFTEADVNADINEDWDINDTRLYYLLLQDNIQDGKMEITNGRLDDDNDLTDRWAEDDGWWIPVDLYGPEGGVKVYDQTFDERWVEVGSLWGWPIAFPVMLEDEVSNTATLTTLVNKEWQPFNVSENVSIFLTAKTFTNDPIDANVTVEKLMVMYADSMDGEMMNDGFADGGTDEYMDDKMMNQDMGPQFVNINSTGTIEDGIGTLIITSDELQEKVGDFMFGEFVVTLNITDSANKSEIVERHFMVEDRSMEGGKGYY